jgi:hypothetical protein
VGPATDVWALGVVLYELITGKRPFPGQRREELKEPVCRSDFVRPRARCPRLDRRVEAVILRCLAKSPEQRYPSAGALADALAACQRPRFRGLLWGMAASVAALGLLAALWAVGLIMRPPDPEVAYLRQVDPIVERFERDGEIDLITAGPDGQTVPFIRPRNFLSR